MDNTGVNMNANLFIDLPSKNWRAYLEDQPNKYPEYFKNSFSEAAMIYFKEMLENICRRAIQNNSCSGFYSFIQSVKNEQTRALMLTWIDSYSPIRQIKTKNGVLQYDVIRDFVPRCSIVDGKSNPYYSLKIKPIKIYKISQKNYVTIALEVDEKNVFDTTRAATSDLELAIKVTKMAFNHFVRERSLDARKILIEKINAIPIGSIEKRGKRFLQGGAPGLGKN